MENKEKKSGGARAGAGAKPKYQGIMGNLVMWIPLVHKEEIRKQFREILKKYKI